MRLVCAKPGIPRYFSTHPEAKGILLERDIVINKGRLRAKLLVFDTVKNLRRFGVKALGKGDLGRSVRGAVFQLALEVEGFRGGKQIAHYAETDPRYYCVICLVHRHLSMQIVSHESVHAGFAYAKRKARNWWDWQVKENEEEAICYPSGLIAAAINRALHGAGLYDK